ncbi:hypothetical protein TrLO_g3145 [Triparma laevis f. longispina]|uniref:Uncharacterized protein n=1 Tax=Triparma laevis f. longispina TaxID=1714387 RepID=A0A9W7C8A6_9STRA|nr:hypothetical protein TrLO_g3145 [Triparma laevis f. longispina]
MTSFSSIDSRYHAIYSEMRERNLNKLTSSVNLPPNFSVDSKMAHHTYRGGADSHRCLSMYSFPKVSLHDRGKELFNELNDLFSVDEDVVLFSPTPPRDDKDAKNIWGKLHWTMMQIQGFNVYEGSPDGSESRNEKNANFGKSIQEVFAGDDSGGTIEIRLIGVIAVSTGLVMIGLPSSDVNSLRDGIRESISSGDLGYNLKEPFVNDIVHSTILRLTGEGDGTLGEKVLDIAKRFGDADLGTMTVEKVNVGEASWRMMDEELERTPAFWSWRIGSGGEPREVRLQDVGWE